jgi:crossover junction endodeoxyribonuclease RuvC
VAVLSGAQAGLPVYEYTPMQVKLAVTGYGKAEKTQVQQMVRVILKLPELPKPDDAADALAVAICHAHSGNRVAALARGGYQ